MTALGLAAAPAHVREAIEAAYANGYADGLVKGREQAEQDMADAWAPVVRHVRHLGSPGNRTAAELADLRGQHERAAGIRADHARRGVVA